MASGPWDNVQLQGPPNGPAWAQAAAQLMGATGNAVNGAFNAYNNQQQFGYQQRQQNLFKNGLPTDANGQPDRAAIIDQLIKAGGANTAQALLPSIMQQPFRDIYLKRLQDNNQQPSEDTGVNSGPGSHTSAASPANITGDFSGSNATNLNTIIGRSGANIPDQVATRIATTVGADSPEADLTPDQARVAQQRVSAYLTRTSGSVQGGGSPNRGGVNPVPPSGNGDQEAASSNELRPSTGEGSSAQSPRQTGERRVQSTAQNAPAGNSPVGAAATVPPQYRNDPNKFLQILRARAERKNEDARLAKLAGFDGSADEKQADAINKQADELQKRLGEDVGRTGQQKEEISGTAEQAKRREIRQVRYDKMSEGIQQSDRAAYLMDDHTRAMFGILENPNLFTGAGQTNVNFLRQMAQNFVPGYDPNKTLPNEALKKVTAQNLQNQLSVLKADAQEAGESAGRVMLAQIRIMQDAAQNPDISVPTLRYLTEMGARASNIQHKIGDMERDYRRSHNGELDVGFEQQLSNFFKDPKNRLMSPMEERDIRYMAAPRLPTHIKSDDEQKAWARQHGVSPGDPIRVNKTYPAQYVPSL